MFQRLHYQLLKSRLLTPRAFIQVLSGPRQVGKTTIAQQLLDQLEIPSHFVAADGGPEINATWLVQQWEVARLKFRQSGASEFVLAIDEIQKIPNWSETVKAQWDLDSRHKLPIKVLLLGSSRLLLQQGLTESLAGRFELHYLGHWSYLEMQGAFGWTPEQYAWYGAYPGAAVLIEDELRWKKYVTDALISPAISRDILSLTRIDKPALLQRLFEFGCLFSGQMLSYNKMLGQLLDAGNTTTLSHYLELLDSAGLLGGLEKFAGDRLRQKQSSPKFQVHNTALISAQRPELLSEIIIRPDAWGRQVESVVGAHLLNYCRQYGHRLFYWREGNDEVDFVLERRGQVIGIEVKSGTRVRPNSGMKRFQKQFSPHKILLIGSEGLSWHEFLAIDPDDLF